MAWSCDGLAARLRHRLVHRFRRSGAAEVLCLQGERDGERSARVVLLNADRDAREPAPVNVDEPDIVGARVRL